MTSGIVTVKVVQPEVNEDRGARQDEFSCVDECNGARDPIQLIWSKQLLLFLQVGQQLHCC